MDLSDDCSSSLSSSTLSFSSILSSLSSTLSSSSSESPFHLLPSDCIHVILHHHIFQLHYDNGWDECNSSVIDDKEKRQLSDLASEEMLENNYNWNFLCKFAHCCRFLGDEGLKEFLSECRDLEEKPAFHYLKLARLTSEGLLETGAVEYLRGVKELHLLPRIQKKEDQHLLDWSRLFINIRGVRTLYLRPDSMGCSIPFTSEHMENLRGIQEAYFRSCDFNFVTNEAYENLRGIKSLTFENCSFQPSAHLMQNLRGIQELCIDECYNVSYENFENLRGIRKLTLSGGLENVDVTDSAMVNLRGAEEIDLADVPNLTSAAFENFRGIKTLCIYECPNVRCDSETLKNLRGIQELKWVSMMEQIILDNESLKQLYGVRSLNLSNIIIPNWEAFQYLSESRNVILSSDPTCPIVTEADILHLVKLRTIELHGMDLRAIRSLSGLLQLPEFERLRLEHCRLSLLACAELCPILGTELLLNRDNVSIALVKNKNGKM